MNHLMLDIETMGNKPTAPIISIGAVFFDPCTGELGPKFERFVDIASSIAAGAQPDGRTIIWWMKQSDAARGSITTADARPIVDVLMALSDFILTHATSAKALQVWGNGAAFDNVILREHYARSDIPAPWEWWNDRDVRTIVELGRVVGFDPKRDMPFEGELHDAIADAKHQVRYVSVIWKKLTATPPVIAYQNKHTKLCWTLEQQPDAATSPEVYLPLCAAAQQEPNA